MPRDANGNYTLPAGNPVVTKTTIDTSWANPTMADIANEITDSLSRSGEGGMLVPFLNMDGNVSQPGISWVNQPNTGFYRAGASDMRVSIAGVEVLKWAADAMTMSTDITASNGLSVNTVLDNSNRSNVGKIQTDSTGNDSENLNTTLFTRKESDPTMPDTGSYNVLNIASSVNTNSTIACKWGNGEPLVYIRNQTTTYTPWRQLVTTVDLANYLPLDGSTAMTGEIESPLGMVAGNVNFGTAGGTSWGSNANAAILIKAGNDASAYIVHKIYDEAGVLQGALYALGSGDEYKLYRNNMASITEFKSTGLRDNGDITAFFGLPNEISMSEIASSTQAGVISTAAQSGSVVFATPFAAAPSVCLTIQTTHQLAPGVSNITTTGFDWTHDSGDQRNIQWIAAKKTQ